MKVLVACEESQVVTMAFRAKGHEAFSCDIKPTTGEHPELHIQDDVLNHLEGWDMIIGFPPCTYLSNAGACRLYPQKGVLNEERYQKGLVAKEFFLKLLKADCQKIAIENPIHSTVFQMPPYTQQIEPYQFGHPYTKKTRLWLKNLPPLIPTNIVKPIAPYVPAGTSRKDRTKYGAAKRGDDSTNRSKTFLGVANAMAEQWG